MVKRSGVRYKIILEEIVSIQSPVALGMAYVRGKSTTTWDHQTSFLLSFSFLDEWTRAFGAATEDADNLGPRKKMSLPVAVTCLRAFHSSEHSSDPVVVIVNSFAALGRLALLPLVIPRILPYCTGRGTNARAASSSLQRRFFGFPRLNFLPSSTERPL